MEFWLERGNIKIQLPVNPPEINGIVTQNFDDIVIGNKEHTVFSMISAHEFNFSSFFPDVYNHTYCTIKPQFAPWEYFDKIKSWCDGKPVKFRVTGTKINKDVTIRSFDFSEKYGDRSVYYDISLKEYVPVSIAKASRKAATYLPKTQKRATTSKKENPKTYSVKSGDTLYALAKKFYGNGNDWNKIYNVNKSVIGKNPNLIKPGQKLVIPS